MRFRPLSRHPFTDVGRTIPEFRSIGLAESKQFHGFSVDKKNVFEIDGESTRLLFQYGSKHVDMFPCNPAAYEQHHAIAIAKESIDSAVHCGLRFISSIPFSVEIGLRRLGLLNRSAHSSRWSDYLQTECKTSANAKYREIKEKSGFIVVNHVNSVNSVTGNRSSWDSYGGENLSPNLNRFLLIFKALILSSRVEGGIPS